MGHATVRQRQNMTTYADQSKPLIRSFPKNSTDAALTKHVKTKSDAATATKLLHRHRILAHAWCTGGRKFAGMKTRHALRDGMFNGSRWKK